MSYDRQASLPEARSTLTSDATGVNAVGCIFVHSLEPGSLQHLVVVSTVLAALFLLQHLFPFPAHDLTVNLSSNADEEALDSESSFLFLCPI
jgi:hypothetical protein